MKAPLKKPCILRIQIPKKTSQYCWHPKCPFPLIFYTQQTSRRARADSGDSGKCSRYGEDCRVAIWRTYVVVVNQILRIVPGPVFPQQGVRARRGRKATVALGVGQRSAEWSGRRARDGIWNKKIRGWILRTIRTVDRRSGSKRKIIYCISV